MYVYVKYLILLVGLWAAVAGICNLEIAPAIVSVGAFLAFALIENRDLKTLNDDKD
jgi:hypothetical protein